MWKICLVFFFKKNTYFKMKVSIGWQKSDYLGIFFQSLFSVDFLTFISLRRLKIAMPKKNIYKYVFFPQVIVISLVSTQKHIFLALFFSFQLFFLFHFLHMVLLCNALCFILYLDMAYALINNNAQLLLVCVELNQPLSSLSWSNRIPNMSAKLSLDQIPNMCTCTEKKYFSLPPYTIFIYSESVFFWLLK